MGNYSSDSESNDLYRSLVYYPPNPPSYTELYPYKVIWIKTLSNKKIPAYYLHTKTKTPVTLVYSHGNAMDIGQSFEHMVMLRDNLNVNIITYDYIGYGLGNSTKPNERGCYESILSVIRYLINLGTKYKDIILYGMSLGSGPSCYMASKYKFGGLILMCPFISCISTITRYKLLGLVDNMDTFNNLDKINNVKCQVLILHGENDDMVTVDHSNCLWKHIPKKYQYKKIIVRDADHLDIIDSLGEYMYLRYIKDFVIHCRMARIKRNRSISW
jgi:pimeloyl-ACP methyl ester carboxylesterase